MSGIRNIISIPAAGALAMYQYQNPWYTKHTFFYDGHRGLGADQARRYSAQLDLISREYMRIQELCPVHNFTEEQVLEWKTWLVAFDAMIEEFQATAVPQPLRLAMNIVEEYLDDRSVTVFGEDIGAQGHFVPPSGFNAENFFTGMMYNITLESI